MKLKQRTIVIIGVLLLLSASVGLVAAMMIPSAEELLTDSLETLETVTTGYAEFSVDVEMPENAFNGTFEGWAKRDVGPNGEPAMRFVVLASDREELVGLTFVTDGYQSWLYSPDKNSVIIGQADEVAPILADRLAQYEGQWQYEHEFDHETTAMPETPDEFVAKLSEYFTIERNGTDQIGEYEANALRLVPIADQMPEEFRLAGGYLNLWLRTSDQLPLAAEYAEGAAGDFNIQANAIEINQPIEDSIFSFTIPEGAEVIQATELLSQMEALQESIDPEEAGALIPAELPDGAQMAGTEQLGTAIVQRFNLLGDLSFVIAQGTSLPQDVPAEATSSQSVTVRGVDGMLHTNDEANRTLLIWQEGDQFVLIGGDSSPQQALALAESLQ